MSSPARKSPEVQTYLRVLGNPYASAQMFDDDEDVPKNAVYRLRGNPYAKLALEEVRQGLPNSESSVSSKLVPKRQSAQSLSKADFRAQARGIFEQYIPPIEKGRLRTHHRDFITRNEASSPSRRHRLIARLKKYDISAMQGIMPQFNRERDALTESKLLEVERSAD